jgi:23S rRNA pseudouridine1911/1915/1917 synthase
MVGLLLQLFPMAEPLVTFAAEKVRPHLGQRLDLFLASALQRSRNHAQGLIREGRVELRPRPEKAEPSYRLRSGDSLIVHPAPENPAAGPAGEAIPLEVIYEDAALLAVNKQAGLVVHPAAGHRSGTLVNALVHHRGAQLARRGGENRLGLVHRLDKETSGLLLIAKTDAVHEKLAAAFAQRRVKKFYRALCWGVFRHSSGECRGALGRHPVNRKKIAVLKKGGRESHTDYRVVARGHFGTEVECLLHTGRTHQIRVHLAHLGHPVWGDLVYGRPHPLSDGFAPPRQMLHAARLEIVHPLTGDPLRLEAPLPADYAAARARLIEETPAD